MRCLKAGLGLQLGLVTNLFLVLASDAVKSHTGIGDCKTED
jgi:hypothetical protein